MGVARPLHRRGARPCWLLQRPSSTPLHQPAPSTRPFSSSTSVFSALTCERGAARLEPPPQRRRWVVSFQSWRVGWSLSLP
jgi:hypothetical protein